MASGRNIPDQCLWSFPWPLTYNDYDHSTMIITFKRIWWLACFRLSLVEEGRGVGEEAAQSRPFRLHRWGPGMRLPIRGMVASLLRVCVESTVQTEELNVNIKRYLKFLLVASVLIQCLVLVFLVSITDVRHHSLRTVSGLAAPSRRSRRAQLMVEHRAG